MRAETKALYPENWTEISRATIEERGGFCSKCKRTPGRHGIVLTVHHKDYNPANNKPKNLVVLCQGCHLRRQARELATATRYYKLTKLIRMGQLELPNFEVPKAKNYVLALRDRVLATSPKSGSHAPRGTEPGVKPAGPAGRD